MKQHGVGVSHMEPTSPIMGPRADEAEPGRGRIRQQKAEGQAVEMSSGAEPPPPMGPRAGAWPGMAGSAGTVSRHRAPGLPHYLVAAPQGQPCPVLTPRSVHPPGLANRLGVGRLVRGRVQVPVLF